ncbi:hypothetical protein HG1285_13447 [Hydrogenivirga sp. 128-5-R1-1]|nr:hypothetical protein HG1285_13447 [Hydrogenivirga sp. 128-5-R1-1]
MDLIILSMDIFNYCLFLPIYTVSIWLVAKFLKVFDVSIAGMIFLSSWIFYSILSKLDNTLFALFVSLIVFLFLYMFIYFAIYDRLERDKTLVASFALFVLLVNTGIAIFSQETVILDIYVEPYLYISFVLLIFILLLFHKTSLWLKLKAFSDNPFKYALLGYSPTKLKLFTILTASVLNTLVILFLISLYGVSPLSSLYTFFDAAIPILFSGNAPPLILALLSAIFAFIKVIVSMVIGDIWQPLITFGLIVILLTLRPYGLYKEIFREDMNA